MNPYNGLGKENNLTYLMNCQKGRITSNILFNIIKLNEEDGILNKFFLTGTYTEYKFKKTNKTTKILIQVIGEFDYPFDDYPSLYIGKYSLRFYYVSQIFMISMILYRK